MRRQGGNKLLEGTMKKYVLGNLEEWDKALDVLGEIEKNKLLDEYQKELIYMIRYNDNWRLREAAIEASRAVNNPDQELINELLSVMKNEGIYVDARIMATDAIGRIIANTSNNDACDQDEICKMKARADECLTNLAKCPQVPVFLEMITKTQERIKS